MTENEAIKRVEEFGLHHAIGDLPHSTLTVKAFEMAIEALQEIQQYRAIGTVEECREARERQKRKKPNGRYKTSYIWDAAYCPACDCGITARWNFCQNWRERGEGMKTKFRCPHGYKKCKWNCDEKCLRTNKKDFFIIRLINGLRK